MELPLLNTLEVLVEFWNRKQDALLLRNYTTQEMILFNPRVVYKNTDDVIQCKLHHTRYKYRRSAMIRRESCPQSLARILSAS